LLASANLKIKKNTDMKNALIVYYSHSGVTRDLAYRIQNLTDADISEVVPVEPYPADVFETIEIFKQERDNKSIRPIVAPDITVNKYDTVFIGTPNWGDTVATPFLDFFAAVDLHDKTIIPFVTHGGGGKGHCAEDIVRLTKAQKYKAPLVAGMRGVFEGEITGWLEQDE
jgi:flavodoxin